MNNMPVFRPDQNADRAHISLKQSIRISEQAQHCAVLWFTEIYNRKLYRDLGFSSMNQYASETLGFSRSKTRDFMLLAKKLDSLPAIKEELASGKLGYTAAREIVPMADGANEKDWLKVAETQSRRELESTVSRAKHEAKQKRKANPAQGDLIPMAARTNPTAARTNPTAQMPVRLGFALSALQHGRYEALMAKLDHHGDKAELLLEMMESFIEAQSPKLPRGSNGPQYQIHVHDCPQCRTATIQTPHGEQILNPVEREAVHCDAQIDSPDQPNTSTIPPKTRLKVLSRDRHKCRRKGCGHTRHLHVHHVIPRTRGGSNEKENLVTLCSACHILWHEQGGDLREMLSEAAP